MLKKCVKCCGNLRQQSDGRDDNRHQSLMALEQLHHRYARHFIVVN